MRSSILTEFNLGGEGGGGGGVFPFTYACKGVKMPNNFRVGDLNNQCFRPTR